MCRIQQLLRARMRREAKTTRERSTGSRRDATRRGPRPGGAALPPIAPRLSRAFCVRALSLIQIDQSHYIRKAL
jgi:hypothetical protein